MYRSAIHSKYDLSRLAFDLRDELGEASDVVVLYIVIGVLVTGLALVSVAGLAIGLLGLIGGVRLRRCTECRHLFAANTAVHAGDARAAEGCPFCRHQVLLHPLAAMHHPHHGATPHVS